MVEMKISILLNNKQNVPRKISLKKTTFDDYFGHVFWCISYVLNRVYDKLEKLVLKRYYNSFALLHWLLVESENPSGPITKAASPHAFLL